MSEDPVSNRVVLVLARDLLLGSRVTAAAAAAGVACRLVRDPAQLASLDGDRLMVDLNQPAAIPAAAAWQVRTGKAVVGFVSHVDAETIQTARDAGISRVIARGAFVQRLPQLLTQPIAADPSPDDKLDKVDETEPSGSAAGS